MSHYFCWEKMSTGNWMPVIYTEEPKVNPDLAKTKPDHTPYIEVPEGTQPDQAAARYVAPDWEPTFKYPNGRVEYNWKECIALGPDGETLFNVWYTIDSYGYPSNGWDDAGEGPEISIWWIKYTNRNELVVLDPKYVTPADEAIQIHVEQTILHVVAQDGPPQEDPFDERI